MSLHLTFLGAAETVTGSRTLFEHGDGRFLVDAGLFQGFKHLRLRNWEPPPFDPAGIEAVVLTHAHLDHSGGVPLLVRQGFRGRVHASPGTAALCRILWADAAFLEEEAAERANRRGTSKHRPAQPLFTAADAEKAMARLHVVREHEPFHIGRAEVTLRNAGHILGATSALVHAGGRRVLMSGDLGRKDDPIHGAPEPPPEVDAIVMESTYGDRIHSHANPEDALAEVVTRTIDRGGKLIVPAFSVGRTQRLLWHLWRLQRDRRIPRVPIFLNSPLADKATRIFHDHPEGHALPPDEADAVCGLAEVARTREESIALNNRRDPCIIIAGSGMATGGRVVHHLRAYAPDPKNTVLFTGFQAGGTRGAVMLGGADHIRIFGEDVPVRCDVEMLDGLSAHADADGLVDWLRSAPRPPGKVWLNHGEPQASDALRHRIEHELGWDARVVCHGQRVEV